MNKISNSEDNVDGFDPNVIPPSKPGHLFPEFLPDDVSLSFEMTGDTLYAVWYLETAFRKSLGAPDMSMDWALGDEDPVKALGQFTKTYHPTQVLAVMSLNAVTALADQIASAKDTFWDKVTKPFKKLYFVEKDQKRYWSTKKEGEVIFEGDLSDINDLAKKGQAILNEKDYDAVFFDVRPIEHGHPKDWLHFMRDAECSLADRFDRLEYYGHDGSK